MLESGCPKFLYKYLDFDGLKKTLEGGSYKLTKPTDFNDPLDVYLQEAFGSDEKIFLTELGEALHEFMESKIDHETLTGPYRHRIILMNTALRRATPDQREEIKRDVLNVPIEQLYNIEDAKTCGQELINSIKSHLQYDGVFSTTTNYKNLLMWAHYADKHRGAVIEFTPDANKDSALLASKAVKYDEIRPMLYRTPKDFLLSALTTTPERSTKNILENIIYTKSPDWRYEEEYRLYIDSIIPKDKPFGLMNFYPHELTAIYLGCRMPDDNKKEAIYLCTRLNPHLKIFESSIAQREFSLEFKKLQ